MPLPLPRLDTRTFDQLVAEGQSLLPLYAASWTDYNAHDPGITLLELLAWLTEIGFYRLDRTPAASLHAFLRLAGVVLKGPQVAEALLIAEPTPPAKSIQIDAGTRVEHRGGQAIFETSHRTHITSARLVAVQTGPADAALVRSDDHLAAGSRFPALGANPQVGDALYLGFDAALPNTFAPLSVYVSTGLEPQDRQTRALLQAEWGAVQAEWLKDTAAAPFHAPADFRRHYAARVVWEYHAGGGVWKGLQDVDDETRALSLSGFVRFRVPLLAPHAAGGIGTPGHRPQFFIRCRLERGRYDCPPRIASILYNALPVRHVVDTVTADLIPRSSGQALQTFVLDPTPVARGSTHLEVTLDGAPDPPWREVSSWDGIGPFDRVYVVSYERGAITFGDGRIGRVPAAGAVLRVKYQIGGGSSGNVAAGTLTRLAGPLSGKVNIRQPFEAAGGEDAEEIDGAISRALATLAAPARAVTLKDIEDLTLSMPGVPIARAHALADYDPEMPCVAVPGSITLVVVPRCPAARPEPTSELLRSVACYLERRRTLTTELHVVGPCFTTVSVQARLHVEADADSRTLADVASAALNEFFDPLCGGPEKTGWPVGRNVYRAEIMALLNDLPDVRYVDEVSLQIGDEQRDRCRNRSVCCHGLVAPGPHQITIDAGSHCQ